MNTFRLFCCLLMLPLVASAQSSAAKSLQGLRSFSVSIEPFASVERMMNLTEDDLQREVELKLRLVGIPIKSLTDSDATIIVNLVALEDGTLYQYYMYHLGVDIQQSVTLSINSQYAYVFTWHAGSIGGGPKGKVEMQIRNQLKDALDKFLNDYLSVNPRSR